MREWDDQAIILRLGLFHERDLWLKTLCRKNGSQTLFAFGGAVSKRRYCGCLDIFNSLQCRVKNSRADAYSNLREATLIGAPRRLRSDWRKMGIANNCLRFIAAFNIGPESSEECFDILEDLRATLERGQGQQEIFVSFFRLRIAAALGFAPELDHCARCNQQVNGSALFNAAEGRIFCPSCAPRADGHCTRLPASALGILRHVARNFPGQWPDNVMVGQDYRACGNAVDNFIQYHLGLLWENGAFRHV